MMYSVKLPKGIIYHLYIYTHISYYNFNPWSWPTQWFHLFTFLVKSWDIDGRDGRSTLVKDVQPLPVPLGGSFSWKHFTSISVASIRTLQKLMDFSTNSNGKSRKKSQCSMGHHLQTNHFMGYSIAYQRATLLPAGIVCCCVTQRRGNTIAQNTTTHMQRSGLSVCPAVPRC